MGLTGNLLTMSLPDILQWIAQGKKTGTLHLERRSVRKKLVFREGQIFSSWSNDPRESLGQILVSHRYVSEEQLFKALLGQETQGRLIGSILVGEGALSEADLQSALREKAEESIFDLFLWPEGRFEFKDDEIPENILFHIDMSVQHVILEGIRRVDEWTRIRKAFPSLRTTFEVKKPDAALEGPEEAHALALVKAGKSLAEIALEMHRNDFDTAALLYGLFAQDVIAVRSAPSEPGAEDPVGAIEHLLTVGYQRLQERRFEEALKAYEDVLLLDRLNQNAKKGLLLVSEGRGRERAMKRVPLEKVPILTRDFASLTKENFDPLEGFVLSRVNGQWDVRSILKLCPIAEENAILIFSRLLDRGVIDLKEP
jgi:Domain of unknown function (DUF4388)